MSYAVGRVLTAAMRLAAITLIVAGPVAAQDAKLPPPEDLRPPASPAFVLLGVAPNAVDRPTTPGALAMTILQRTNDLSALPHDFAIEVSPYWLVPQRHLTWRADTMRSLTQSFQRTMTLSLATANVGTAARPVTAIGIGARASLASGVISKAVQDSLRKLEEGLAHLSTMTAQFIKAPQDQRSARLSAQRDSVTADSATEAKKATTDSEKAAIAARANSAQETILAAWLESNTKAAATDLVRALADPAYQKAEGELDKRFNNLVMDRTGFFLDVAGGVTWQAPRDQVDSAMIGAVGVWATAGYDLGPVSWFAVARVLSSPDSANRLDLGGRINYESPSLNLAGEYVRRTTSGGVVPAQYRLAGTAEVRLAPGIAVTATLGRDFNISLPGSLLAQIGVALRPLREAVGLGGAGAAH
jgi:hypothetical protein